MWHSSLVDVTAFTLCFPCRTQRFLAINKLGSPCFPGITPLLITSFMTCTPTRAILPAVRECIHALKHTVKRRYPSLSTSERRLLVAHSLRSHNIHGKRCPCTAATTLNTEPSLAPLRPRDNLNTYLPSTRCMNRTHRRHSAVSSSSSNTSHLAPIPTRSQLNAIQSGNLALDTRLRLGAVTQRLAAGMTSVSAEDWASLMSAEDRKAYASIDEPSSPRPQGLGFKLLVVRFSRRRQVPTPSFQGMCSRL